MASASPPLDQGLKELNDAESPDEDGSDSQMQDAGSKAREEDESRAPPPPREIFSRPAAPVPALVICQKCSGTELREEARRHIHGHGDRHERGRDYGR